VHGLAHAPDAAPPPQGAPQRARLLPAQRACLAAPAPQVIVGYLLDAYRGVGPPLQPETPELRAVAALATRLHDLYITTIQVRGAGGSGAGGWGLLWARSVCAAAHARSAGPPRSRACGGWAAALASTRPAVPPATATPHNNNTITPPAAQGCMYKKMSAEQRAAELAALAHQLDVLEGLAVGPFLAGGSISSADGALAPTFAFLTYILPRYFGWADVFAGRPKLAAWWAAVNADPVASRVSLLLMLMLMLMLMLWGLCWARVQLHWPRGAEGQARLGA
jgi:glutathione S-transferase